MNVLPFGPGALAFIALYLLSLVWIGWLGRQAREENSMRDHFIGGSGVGFFVLLLTLYATQYSGNTILGFSGKASRVGFSWLASVHFMTAIVITYLILAPKLFTPAAIVLVQRAHLSYAQAWALAGRTTRRMQAIGLVAALGAAWPWLRRLACV